MRTEEQKKRRHDEYLLNKQKYQDYNRAQWEAHKSDPEFVLRNRKRAQAWYHANKGRKQTYDKVYAPNHRDQRRKSGLEWYHRNPEKQREWERNNPDKVKASKRKWEQNNPATLLANNAKRRARIAGCATDTTAAAFYKFVRSQKSIPCYYCGRKVSGNKAHIVSRNGNHASENLCASCRKCNLIKNAKLPSETAFNGQPLLNL